MTPNFMKQHITGLARGMFNLSKNCRSKIRSQANRSSLITMPRKPSLPHLKDRQNSPKI